MVSDASIRRDSTGQQETSLEDLGEPPLQAARSVWYVWVIGLVALVATVFFYFNQNLWSNYAELFYTITFGIVTLVAFAYGTYTVHNRTSPL